MAAGAAAPAPGESGETEPDVRMPASGRVGMRPDQGISGLPLW
jgi:hypothetical protein